MKIFEVVGMGLAGRPAQARARIDRLRRERTGNFPAVFFSLFDGVVALHTGRVGAAARLLREFRPVFPGHGGGWTSWWELLLAQARAMGGDAKGAREALDRADAFRHPGFTILEPELTLARAWLAAAEGGVTAAVELARQAAELAAASGQWAVEVLARHAAVSFGDREQSPRLAELAECVDGPRAPAAAAHAAALAAEDPAALQAASVQLELAELLVHAADAAAQAAELYRQRAEPSATAAAAARAVALARTCGTARTPALLGAATPLPITRREREVATLAATGLSNRRSRSGCEYQCAPSRATSTEPAPSWESTTAPRWLTCWPLPSAEAAGSGCGRSVD